tara:strand:+ start:246 stop:380 length:135 start_codon:yes stop_codon:yes gene_type:complete
LLLKLLKLKIIAIKKNSENSIEFERPPRYKEAGSIDTRGKYQNK